MRNRWWTWGAGLVAALMIAAVALPQTSDAAQRGRSMGGGGNSQMMRKMMLMKKMRKRQAMKQGTQGTKSATGAANAAGS